MNQERPLIVGPFNEIRKPKKRNSTKPKKSNQKLVAKLVVKQDYKCGICYKPLDMWMRGPSLPTLDHIIPRSKRGGNQPSNLRATHAKCNNLKGDKLDDPT